MKLMNKKAIVVTWCNNNGRANYGQVLQCYAMQELLKEQGFHTSVLRYRKKGEKDWIKKSDSSDVLNFLYELWYEWKIEKKKFHKKKWNFWKFTWKYIRLLQPCYTIEQVEEVCKDAQLLVCGSDQIWNPLAYDSVWYLDFQADQAKKTAYAPSLGTCGNEFQEILEKMGNSIQKLDAISVRERTGIELLKPYVSKKITQVLDPTLLLSKEQWSRLAAKNKEQEPYMLCYILGNNASYLSTIRKIQKQYGMKKIVFIATDNTNKGLEKVGTVYEDAGPKEFLSLIKNAEVVCTDSFHGIVFSILFEREFYAVKRNREQGWSSFERIQNLLDKTGLKSRIAEKSMKTILVERIDYREVKEKLEKEIEQSGTYLEYYSGRKNNDH